MKTKDWYCLRSKPKHENIAAAHLQRKLDVEVFFPRISYTKPSKKGLTRLIEPMFPNYLFVRFKQEDLAQVRSAPGIAGIVRFGEHYPTIPNATIHHLQEMTYEDNICVIENKIQKGDTITIAKGPFQGLQALVQQVLPAKERVHILLDFLGRTTELEISKDEVYRPTLHPLLNHS